MKKKIGALIFIVFALAVIAILFSTGDDSAYSEKNCLETYIPCVNAYTANQTVKVFNGTSSLEQEDGSFIYGDFFKGDRERQQMDVLTAAKNEIITLEFINKDPLNITVYQLDGEERDKEIPLTRHAFAAPSESGTYSYELFGEYSNGTVHHYLKIKVEQ